MQEVSDLLVLFKLHLFLSFAACILPLEDQTLPTNIPVNIQVVSGC